MADAIDTPAAAKKRSPAPRKTKATNASPGETASATDASFGQSAQHARAALDTASAAAKAKVKAVSDKAKAAKENVSAFDWKAQGDQVKSQAGKMAREAAGTAKAKTGVAMEGLAKLIADTAQTVDTKLGPQYGDYARSAASAVAGAAKSLDEKDIDQLLGEARDFVRKSPAVAIGAAAIAGYVLMRLAKGSGDKDA